MIIKLPNDGLRYFWRPVTGRYLTSDLYAWRSGVWEKDIGVLPVSWSEQGDE
jgi:hypothetical protein